MFEGFPPGAFKFFRGIARHNRREWYLAHKDEYVKNVVEPAHALVATLNEERALRALGLHMPPKKALFRLHRDTRFSSDKSPFKTYNGIVINRSGERHDPGVLYLNIQPGDCYIASGFWHPDPQLLTRFRLWMTGHPKGWKALVRKLGSKKIVFSREEVLKRTPRGFERVEDKVVLEHLRLKNFTGHRMLSESDMQSAKLVKRIAQFATDSAPLLKMGWAIVDQWRLEGGDEEFRERSMRS